MPASVLLSRDHSFSHAMQDGPSVASPYGNGELRRAGRAGRAEYSAGIIDAIYCEAVRFAPWSSEVRSTELSRKRVSSSEALATESVTLFRGASQTNQSVVVGGYDNTARAQGSLIVGGRFNQTTANY